MNNEAMRQGIHAIVGIVYALLFLFLPIQTVLALLTAAFALGSLLSDAHKKGAKIPFITEIISGSERENESSVPGLAALEFTLGAIITAVIFYWVGGTIIAGGILVLAVGDAASTLIGKKFGSIKILGNRTLEGTVAGIIAAAIALSPLFSPVTAIAAATAGMLAEYLPVNDNYTIPIAAAIALVMLA